MQTNSDHKVNIPAWQRRRSRPAALLHLLLVATIVFGFGAMLIAHPDPDVASITGAGDAPHALFLPNVGGAAIETCHRDPTPNAFGVQMYGNTGETSPYYNSLRESGAQWVRVPIEWDRVEPQNTVPGAYNWSSADQAVGAATDGCYHVIVTHRGAPAWAATNPHSVVTELDELVEYLRAAVERYDGDGFQDAPGSPVVNLWELYNEPDAGIAPTMIGWGYHPQEYATMLQTVYPVIKAANPNAQVVMGGIAYDWFADQPPPHTGPFIRTFMEDVLKAGGGDYFDIMNFHSYPAFRTVWADQGPGLFEKATHLRELLADYGHDKPFVITESGWHSDDTRTPDEQSTYIVQLFTQSLAADIDFLIYWMLHDPGDAVHPHESGLVTQSNPPQKKPAFDTYRTVVQKLADTTYLGRVPDSETRDPDMDVYKFDAPARNQWVYVAWLNPIEATYTEPLSLSGSQATVTAMYGVTTTVHDSDDGSNDGQIRINVGAKPIYIEIAK